MAAMGSEIVLYFIGGVELLFKHRPSLIGFGKPGFLSQAHGRIFSECNDRGADAPDPGPQLGMLLTVLPDQLKPISRRIASRRRTGLFKLQIGSPPCQ
jgi:hypothetical protein